MDQSKAEQQLWERELMQLKEVKELNQLRDTFAAAALTGLLAGNHIEQRNKAEWAYDIADKMLAARRKQA